MHYHCFVAATVVRTHFGQVHSHKIETDVVQNLDLAVVRWTDCRDAEVVDHQLYGDQ